MMEAETLWIKEKADGIYPRISKAARQMDHQPGFGRLCLTHNSSDLPETGRLPQSYSPSPCPTPWHAPYKGHRAGPGLFAHTCAKENKHSQNSQGKRKCFGPQGHGSYNLQQVHKSPNSHLSNISPERMDAGATMLCLLKQSSSFPLWEAVHRSTHTCDTQPVPGSPRQIPARC